MTASTIALDPPKIVIARIKDIPQSPLKMKFLVSLVRKAWVPDALAQLKFSPKHRAIDIKKLILVTMFSLVSYQIVTSTFAVL